MKNIKWILVVLLTSNVFAKNLGVYGDTYPIIEDDLLEFIEHRIESMKQTGEWEKLQHNFKEDVRRNSERPAPVTQITHTNVKSIYFFDPSIILKQDLKDQSGRIFAKKGTHFNPLDLVSLRLPLLFIDGDDSAEIKWAKNLDEYYQHQIKIILVQGSIKEAVKTFQQKIYFDQKGHLTKHFHIKHVPAIVTQKDTRLRISEEVA